MKRLVYYVLVFIIAFVVGAFFTQIRSPKTYQPIKYNHRLHVIENEMECTDCHQGAKSSKLATLPSITVCLDCHDEALTDSKEEEKIRTFRGKGMDIPWQKILRMPDHVYFSHYRHTVLAKIDCFTCHGRMDKVTSPPDKPLKRMRMKDCIQCHKKNKVTQDCIACHR